MALWITLWTTSRAVGADPMPACAFPADATTAYGSAVTGSSEADLAVKYSMTSASGPNSPVINAGDKVQILRMVPPAAWRSQYDAQISAAFKKRWHSTTPMQEIGHAWFAEIRYASGRTSWIANEGAINAPALGGTLANGPTACSVDGKSDS